MSYLRTLFSFFLLLSFSFVSPQLVQRTCNVPTPPVPADETRAWLIRGSGQHKALGEVVNDKSLLVDIHQLSEFCRTCSLENFHSVLLKWAPERVHLSYGGMRARVQLACLSHNENVSRAHARTSKDILRYRIEFTRGSKHWVVKCINEPASYDFLSDILKSVHDTMLSIRRGEVPECVQEYSLPVLPRLIAPVDAPSKETLVQQHMSRMSH